MNSILQNKLEEFLRKYYLNQLVRGAIYAVGISLAYFFVLAIAEYFGRFSGEIRKVLFVLLCLGLGFLLVYFVIIPLFKLFRLGKRLSYKQAARIIGFHFKDIDDKLLNTLEFDEGGSNNELIKASVDQRMAQLKPIPFTSAIDLSQNKKYWPVLAIPVFIFAILAVSGSWNVVSEGSKRLVAYNTEFVPEAPFTFDLLNESLETKEGESLKLELGVNGMSIPTEVFLVTDLGKTRMVKNKEGNFSFTVPNLKASFSFRFEALGFFSKSFNVSVLEVPSIKSLLVNVKPPVYTGVKPFIQEVSELSEVPEGSTVEWQILANKADNVWWLSDSAKIAFEQLDMGFSFSKVMLESCKYSVHSGLGSVDKTVVGDKSLNVLKDEFPVIEVFFERDSIEANQVYFTGSVADDYGLSKLQVVIHLGENKIVKRVRLQGSASFQPIGDVLHLDSLVSKDGEDAKVYLELWDNDGVNGAKKVVSSSYRIPLKSKDQRLEDLDKAKSKNQSQQQNNRKELDELTKSLKKLKEELSQRKSLKFNDKKRLEQLLEQQEKYLNKAKELEKELEELSKKEDLLKEKPEEIKEKEKEIDEMAKKDEEELAKLMEEIQELMEKLDLKQLEKRLDKLQKMNEEQQRQEDRSDKMKEDLEFQKDILDQADKLNELAKEMEKLADKENGLNKEEELEKQKEVEEKAEAVKKKVEEMKKENDSFEKEAEKAGLDEETEEMEDAMSESEQELNDSKGGEENDSQQKAGEKMKEMSQSMQDAMMGMQSQANQENMETLRQILDNLEFLSHEVEELSERSKKIEANDPSFKVLLGDQNRLLLGAKVIEDSLLALSERTPKVKEAVFKELEMMSSEMAKSLSNLQELRSAKAAGNQQHVMTASNNLALMLDQSLQQMMQMMAQSKPGQQQCQKPGNKPGSKPSMSQLVKAQGELGKVMGKMKQGNKKGDGERGMSGKELVKTISKQEQLRKVLEEMSENPGKDGSAGNLHKAIEEMKKLEEELLQGKVGANYKERIEEIQSRMLEHEKAERKQEQSPERESTEAKDLRQIRQEELDKYLKEKRGSKEGLSRQPVLFKRYYKKKSNEYFK